MLNIIKDIDQHYQKKRQVYPQYVNRASSAGFPCTRELVYERLNWKEKLLPSIDLQYIFEEGNNHEQTIKRLLMEIGYEIIEGQRTFEWKELELSGHFEGRIAKNGEKYQFEIKTLNQFDWEKLTDDPQCLLKSSKTFIQKWYAQPQLYLLLDTEPHEPISIMLIKNKQNGKIKQINIPLDYEYAEQIAKKLELVNKHVAAKTYPERIDDRTICQYCDFRHICLPDEQAESIELTDDPELLELLEERDRLRESAKDYEKVDEKLKEYWKRTQPGIYLVGGEFQVKISLYKRPVYSYPEEIKDKYKTEMEYTKAIITKLKDE